jgi:hypothetical protein
MASYVLCFMIVSYGVARHLVSGLLLRWHLQCDHGHHHVASRRAGRSQIFQAVSV